MPFHLGHDVARFVPALRLIAEAGVVTPYLVWRSPDRAFEQMSDLVLQDTIGRQANRVAGTLGFKKFIYFRIGEACVASEVQMLYNAPVAGDHRLQYRASAIGTVHVSRS